MAALQKLREPVLVTGAAGFIGRRLVHRLLDDGKQVVAFDLAACPESLQGAKGLKWMQGDISRPRVLDQAVTECGTLIHLAAMVGDWGKSERHRAVTVEGTRQCFESALLNESLRVVLASSIVVYGEQIDAGVCHEALPLGQTFGPYSESKQAQERLAQQFLQRGLDVRIVRPANVYGSGSRPWVEQLGEELLRGVPVLIAGGNFDAGLVHVDNVVEVLLLAARVVDGRGQIYNAADEEGITWKQYMSDLADLFGAPEPRVIPKALAHYMAVVGERAYRLVSAQRRPPITREALNLVGSRHQISMAKTRAHLRFQTKTPYKHGLAELARYIANH